MSESLSPDSAERVACLERRVRRLQSLLSGALVVTIAGLVAAWTSPDNEVRTQSLILVDKDGKERGGFALVDNVCALTISDQNGLGRVYVGYTADAGSVIQLYDEREHQRVTLCVPSETVPGLTFLDKDSKPIWSAPDHK